jgi:hypothetical protein
MSGTNNDGLAGVQGPINDLLRLQSDFQQRLANETLRYLRQLQGLVGPVVPGTLVLPDPGFQLEGSGAQGGLAVMDVMLENRQRVHCLVSPVLTPLVSDRGVTWFVEATLEPSSVLLAEGDSATLRVTVAVPRAAPSGVYRGALLMHGFEKGSLPVRVTVADATADAPAAAPEGAS